MPTRLIAAGLTLPALLGLLPGPAQGQTRATPPASARPSASQIAAPNPPPSAAPAPPTAAADPGIALLLDAAQLWQLRQRNELARGVLNKVLALRADEPRALLLLGELDLRTGRKDAPLAQLTVLQNRHPTSVELRDLQQLAVLYSSDRARLTRLRQMLDTDRLAEAATLARQMFPDARPPGMLGAELAGLLASTPGGWDSARRAAAARVAATGTALDRLALAEVMALRPGGAPAGGASTATRRAEPTADYPALLRDSRLPREVVAASWRRAIRLQPPGSAFGPLWREYKVALGEIDAAGPTAAGAAPSPAVGPTTAAAATATPELSGTPARSRADLVANGVGTAGASGASGAAGFAGAVGTAGVAAAAGRTNGAAGTADATGAAAAALARARVPATPGREAERGAATPELREPREPHEPDPAAQVRLARDRALSLARRLAQVDLDVMATQAAVDRLAASLDRWGDDGATWGLLGIAQLRLDRHALAASAFEHAARLDANDAADVATWTRLAGTARYWGAVAVARAAVATGDDARAVALLAAVLPPQAAAPADAIEAQLLQAAALVRLAWGATDNAPAADAAQATRAERIATALARYREVLAIAPDEARALAGLFALQLAIDPDAALAELRSRAGEQAGRYVADADVRAAVERRRAERGDAAALQLLEHALALVPDRAWLRYDAARHHLDRQDPERARAEMALGLAAAPNQDAMREAAAEIALQSDDPDGAVVLLARWVDGPLPGLPFEATAAGPVATGVGVAAVDGAVNGSVDTSGGAADGASGDAPGDAAADGSADAPDATVTAVTTRRVAVADLAGDGSAPTRREGGDGSADGSSSQASAEAEPPPRALIRRALYAQALAQALRALEAEQTESARAALDRAEIESDGQPDTTLRLARLRLAAGQPALARARLAPLPVDGLRAAQLIEWAGLLADAGGSTGGPNVEPTAGLNMGPNTGPNASLSGGEIALDALQRRLERSAATAPAGTADAAAATDVGATDRADLSDHADSEADWAQIALLHAKLALDLDLPRTARIGLDALARRLPPQALAERLRLLRLQRRVGDSPGARLTLQGLLAQAPQMPEVRLEAARLARADADDSGALVHLDIARRRAAAGSAAATAVEQVQDAIDADHQVRAEFGQQASHHPGSAGLGRLDTDETTLRVSWPQGPRADLFVQIDRLSLDAGSLGADPDSAKLLGRVGLNAPLGLAAPAPQAATGQALGLGWLSARDEFDVGLVDVGVRRWLGGWRHRVVDRDDTDLTLRLSRRLLTDSLLSWGGALDPSDGARRGGVTLDALQVSLRQALGPRDTLTASALSGVLRGREVVRNGTVQLRAGFSRDLARSPGQRLRVGLDSDLQFFGNNLSFHTAGQGGYYSPQQRLGLALPLELSGLNGRLAYRLQGRLSYAWARERDTPYYPGDPAAQAAAGNPPHLGGPGRGAGASLLAAAEWRASPSWALGAALSADHASDYAVARGQVYLRHWFGRVPPPLDWPPQALQPYVRR